MMPDELVDLVNQIITQKHEGQTIELKSANHGTPKRLYDTLSSFSNQIGGGIIIFGIDEKDNYNLVGVYDPQELQVQVTNQAKQMQPNVRPVFTAAEIQGKIIVSAEIAECDIYDKPCFYTGAGRMRGSYIRVGEADCLMTEYEVYSYEAFKRNIEDELRIVERATIEDFDRDSLNQYFIKLRQNKPNLAQQTDEKILQLQGLTDNNRPTLAGIMLLAEYPQAFFPQLSINAMVVDGTQIGELALNGARFIDNQRIEGRISQMLEDAIAFVRRNTRTATIITENGTRADRSEYPTIAIREIILNALIHRDYSIHTDHSPIQIVLYKDRIEIENPGGIYGRLTVEDLGKRTSADTRNPFIAGALEVLLGTENRYSGIPTIIREMANAGLPPAKFESSRGTFKVTLYNEPTAPLDTQPPLDENLRAILNYCTTPRSRREITDYLGMSSQAYVVKHFINPLLEQNLLRRTLPQTPKSKKQKFVITHKLPSI